GAAEYIDDIREPEGTLHVAVGGSPHARGRLVRMDLAKVRAYPGVHAVVTASDIPGKNDISPAHADEPVLAFDRVMFHGQPIFAVIAATRDIARRASTLAVVEIDREPPNVTVDQGLLSGETLLPDYAFVGGDADATIARASHRLDGVLRIGGQEHFYLE